ncbi:BRCA1-associated protein-like [Sinocyclocheilus grahami]|uniref:BRCA1-associated protein-like n=1 Tax=Sinocyclocheilus grahami TaxID=75366 RepID=UPI0007ACD817|nr:PREDICTED: BRCA1-associated protein-like [Sinocyclocheilus grahami]
MSVSLVVIRLELADRSESPHGFQYCAVSEMSEDEMREKALTSARATLGGKPELERAAVLHQHLGSRVMSDMVIETFQPSAGAEDGKEDLKSTADVNGEVNDQTDESVTPDSPSKQLPDQISFFSGNPSVEIVHGIMHLYKTNKMTSLTEDVRRSAMLCILTVPTTMTSHDLMKFVAPFNDVMEHMKIIRDSMPNQYMVLVKFRSQADADSFYTTCNGRQFNSIEDAVCQLVYVERAEVIKSEEGASLPVMDLTELPKCTVCLERMDESVNGVLTTLCNHSFHSQCLQRWEDASCPVCRYCQTPEPVEENKCFECGVQEVNNYVHRLVASKTDGKMVQYECEGDTCQDEKIDALQLEVYTVFCAVFCRCSQLNNKVVKLSQELREEQEMNRCLRANQTQLQAQLQEEERRAHEAAANKDGQIAELQEQLRDVMFYLETQQQIDRMPADARQEIQEGQINIAAAPQPGPSAHGPGKLSGRKGRSKRGK